MMKMSNDKRTKISRREFLVATSGISFSFLLPGSSLAYAGSIKGDNEFHLAWVTIDTDNRITIMSPAAELGQGSMTSIPMIFAEELDADWNDVNIEVSPADDGNFKNPTSWAYGIMLTLGSSTVSGYYDSVRHYGAQARKLLLLIAAKHWNVPVETLTTEPSVVVHRGTSQRLRYGEIAKLASGSEPLPDVTETDLKPVDQFRIIGSHLPRCDVPGKVTGRALYSIDVNLPGMLFASVTHSPVKAGIPLSVRNETQLAKRTDVLRIITLADAVAIVSRTYEAAHLAEKELDIQWSEVSKLVNYSDAEALEMHLRLVRNSSLKGMPVQEQGNVDAALKMAAKTWQAEYLSDYLYHAQLEPLNAVANVQDNGKTVDIWAGTQAPTHCVRSVAQELGITVDKVHLHRTYLGGAFGRRGAQDHDYVIDAVQLSRQMQLPVKVIWSREADVKAGRFKPMKAMLLRAGGDAQGRLTAWSHRTASDEALKQSDPYRYEKAGGWPVISSSGMDIDYDIENISAEIFDPDTGVRAAPLRGIGGTVNKFASECFLDEIALAKNVDPLDLRLELLHKHTVAKNTLNAVAEMSNWNNRRPGGGLGLAFNSVYYPTAYVVKVAVDNNTGVISIPKVWVALDVGMAIHPQNIIGQMEGQIIFAISNVLKERITFTNGAVNQSNFHDYQFMRMSEIPEIEVKALSRKNSKPTGVGDCRLTALPAAIGNGFANLTGKRLRHLPLIPARVLETLST